MPEKIEPTCRYGHGPLAIVESPDMGHEFLVPTVTPMTVLQSGNKMFVSPPGYVFSIFKCPVCTYVELHDLEE